LSTLAHIAPILSDRRARAGSSGVDDAAESCEKRAFTLMA
jgi:hypothetical protein